MLRNIFLLCCWFQTSLQFKYPNFFIDCCHDLCERYCSQGFHGCKGDLFVTLSYKFCSRLSCENKSGFATLEGDRCVCENGEAVIYPPVKDCSLFGQCKVEASCLCDGETVKTKKPPAFSSIRQAVLVEVNAKRLQHDSPPMKIDVDSSFRLMEYVSSLKNLAPLKDPGLVHYFSDVRSISEVQAIQQAIEFWYSKEQYFKYNEEVNSVSEIKNLSINDQDITAFSQLIWKSSTQLSCAVNIGSHGTIVVARFDPPGNEPGEFVLNVLPPTRKDNVHK